jgi:DNA topoisomerase-1
MDATLVYSDDTQPGYRRVPARGQGFRYLDTQGRAIRRASAIRRIDALAIPPAYTDVWICPSPHGHIQATARDARKRKQYRYHPEWIARRDADKYGQLPDFGLALPRIRRRVEQDLRAPGLPRRRMLALVARLLETTLIRIGGEKYAASNHSYGLTTIRNRHAQVRGERIRLRFTGKSGVRHDVTVRDRRLANLVRRCLDIPGQRLFQYLDEDGREHPIDSDAVNDYLREASGADFTAKDYRTWAGSVLAYAAFQRRAAAGAAPTRKQAAEVVKEVAARLANTPAVCRRCYIHPDVIAAYESGSLPPRAGAPPAPRGLNADERRFLAFLQRRRGPGMALAGPGLAHPLRKETPT